jgi:hypothetical protein
MKLRKTSLGYRYGHDIHVNIERDTITYSGLPRTQNSLYASNKADVDVDSKVLSLQPNPLRLVYGLLWFSFVTYAYTLAPGSAPINTDIDAGIIKTMVTTPFDGTVNPIFTAIFNALGILPAVRYNK